MGTTPQQYIIGIIIFMFVIVGGISLLNIYKDSGASFVNDERFDSFNKTFNKVDDVTGVVDDLQTSIEQEENSFGIIGQVVGVLDSLINGAWNTLKLLFGSLIFMNDAYNGLNTFFGVPVWVSAMIGLIVTVMLVFAIFGAIFQRDL